VAGEIKGVRKAKLPDRLFDIHIPLLLNAQSRWARIAPMFVLRYNEECQQN
jgi:hypothetical protein